MALTDRVVLFNDFGPQGREGAEVCDRGLGVCTMWWRCLTRAAGCAWTTCDGADPGAPVRRCQLPPARRRRPGRHGTGRADPGRCAGAQRYGTIAPGWPAMSVAVTEGKRPKRLAINRLLDRRPLDERDDRALHRPPRCPIVEGARATFLWRGEADEVGCATAWWGCPTRCRCGGSRTPTSGTSTTSCPRARASSTSSRSGAASTTSLHQRPAQPAAGAQPRRRQLGPARHRATTCRTGCTTTPRPGRARSYEH